MPQAQSLFFKLADAVSFGAASARFAENESRKNQAEAECSYYSEARRVISSMPGIQPPSGGIPNRTDSPYALGESDFGNLRYQDTIEITYERWRSRQLEQTNWLASSTLDRAAERTIGTLILVEPRTEDDAFNDEVSEWLQQYWYTTLCDLRGRYTLSEFCHLVFRGELRDGDVGVLLTEDTGHNPKLQLIEAQRIKTPNNAEQLQQITNAGNQVVDGVEMDSNGMNVAYWISTQPPGKAETFVRVDARDFIFQCRTTRYGNVRGEPGFRGGYWLFDQVMGYLEAVVQAARVGACQAMIQKRRNPGTPDNPNAVGKLQPNVNRDAIASGQQQRLTPIVPAMINVIGTDEDLVAFNPTQPTQSFPEAIVMFSRFVASRFGVCVEDILFDFTKTTYSSSKVAKAAVTRATGIKQENFARTFISRSYQWALSKAVKNGEFKTPAPANFWAHEWLPPTWESVEPLKDAQADERNVALGTECRSNIATAKGYNFRKLCEQNDKDQETMVKNHLSTAIAVGTTGNTQPEDTSGTQSDANGSGAVAVESSGKPKPNQPPTP